MALVGQQQPLPDLFTGWVSFHGHCLLALGVNVSRHSCDVNEEVLPPAGRCGAQAAPGASSCVREKPPTPISGIDMH